MSEPTLAAAFNDLQGDVGHFLGYGRGTAFKDPTWTDPQQQNVTRCVKGGMRRFYYCDHEWTFLRPVATLAIAADATSVALPDDFGYAVGRLVVSVSAGTIQCVLDFGGVGRVYQSQMADPSATGWPQACAVVPLAGTGARDGQRSELHVYPTTDQAYTLTFQYAVNPNYLTGDKPYAYGGPAHAETLLAACKATAEIDLDDAPGTQVQEFMRLLDVSKDIDRRSKPHNLGYNGDHSDARRPGAYRQDWREWPTVTFNGTAY